MFLFALYVPFLPLKVLCFILMTVFVFVIFPALFVYSSLRLCLLLYSLAVCLFVYVSSFIPLLYVCSSLSHLEILFRAGFQWGSSYLF